MHCIDQDETKRLKSVETWAERSQNLRIYRICNPMLSVGKYRHTELGRRLDVKYFFPDPKEIFFSIYIYNSNPIFPERLAFILLVFWIIYEEGSAPVVGEMPASLMPRISYLMRFIFFPLISSLSYWLIKYSFPDETKLLLFRSKYLLIFWREYIYIYFDLHERTK